MFRTTQSIFLSMEFSYLNIICSLHLLVRGILRMRSLAKVVPTPLLHVDPIMLGRFLYVCESHVALLVGDILDLVEARQRVPDVRCVGQRLLALLRKSKHAVG